MNSLHQTAVILLAAGKGTRMNSQLPKVLHTIDGVPMILYPLLKLKRMGFGQIITVVKHGAEQIIPVIEEYSDVCYQEGEAYGTAKAVESALQCLQEDITELMVLNGDDSAFYAAETIQAVVDAHVTGHNDITFVTLRPEDPTGYGRIVYDRQGKFQAIVEEKDATEEQKKIREINDGLYLFHRAFVQENIALIPPSPVTGEFYLTELLRVAVEAQKKVETFLLEDPSQFFGVSTQEDLQEANELMKQIRTQRSFIPTAKI